MTHWPLDVLVHRPDVSLTASPNRWLFGTYLFNFPILIFFLDLGLTLTALYYHKLTNVPMRPDANSVYGVWFALFTLIQADFSFYGAPTKQARWLHAPLFAGQILAIAWGLGFLDKYTRPRLEIPAPQSLKEFTESAKIDAKNLVDVHKEKLQHVVDVNNEKISEQHSAM